MAGTVVICFTDIVGSTELLTRLGDDRFDDLRRRHFDLLELATAARLRGTSGDDDLASQAVARARRAMTDVGMPGWLERLERLDAGDLKPWRI